jgi:hypothetical protein
MELVEERLDFLDMVSAWSEEKQKDTLQVFEKLAAIAMQLDNVLQMLNNPAFTPEESELARLSELVGNRIEEQQILIESLTSGN